MLGKVIFVLNPSVIKQNPGMFSLDASFLIVVSSLP
jgi:hypothetical protein